jgi:hypothetical protein
MKKHTKKLSKSIIKKLVSAKETLSLVTNSSVVGNTIILDDINRLIAGSDNQVLCSLLFYNVGVATSTDIYIDKTIILNSAHGSIIDFPIGTNNSLAIKRLYVYSVISATTLTSLPQDFKAELVLKGGQSTVKFPVQGFTFNEVGDSVELELAIFFY